MTTPTLSRGNPFYHLLFSFCLILFLSACAGPNPNPGERTTDMGWLSGDFSSAYKTARPYAEQGAPWAQLRLGIFYANGWGVKKDSAKALTWYEKAASHYNEDGWSKGNMLGAAGTAGYFNQNSDAIIAKFNMAQMYYVGEGASKNLEKALELVAQVILDSKGESVFFCCEFDQGRYFNQAQFQDLKTRIEMEISNK